MKELDAEALDLVQAYGNEDCDAALLRFDGDSIVVICTDTKAALDLMKRAVAELTAPSDRVLQ